MKKFVTWISAFGALGVLIPAVLMIRFWIFHHPFGALETKLWPGSLMFFGLDAPNTTILDVVLFYGIALVENAVLYAVIGVLTWPLAYIALGLRSTHSRLAINLYNPQKTWQ